MIPNKTHIRIDHIESRIGLPVRAYNNKLTAAIKTHIKAIPSSYTTANVTGSQ